MPGPGPAIWHGHVTFGLISLPVALVSATERHTTPFHLIHATDCHGRIRYRKACELDGETVDEHDIGRGYETPAGVVPLTDADLEHLPITSARTLQLAGFVPADRIDLRQVGAASYYLRPTDTTPATLKPYVLLRDALARTDRVAIVTFAIRGDRERLGILRPLRGGLAVHALLWPDEIRPVDPALVPPPADVDEDELAAALALIDACTVETLDEIPDLVDHYAEALDILIDAKTRHRPTPAGQPRPHEREATDLLATLERSVRAARTARGEDPGPMPGDQPRDGSG